VDQLAAVEEKTVEVFGMKLRYLEAGPANAPTILLIAAPFLRKETWQLTGHFDAFAAQYHVYALDNVGQGNSDKPLINYSIGTLVDFLGGFMDAVKIQKASLVSTSIGAWAIIVFALRNPDRVERLILITPEGIAPQPGELNPRGVDLNPATLEGMRRTLDVLFFDKATWTNDQTVKALFSDKMQADYSFVFQKLIESGFVRGEFMVDAQQLSQLRVPTLFVWGQQDEIVTLSYGRRYASLVAGARLLVIENAGHLPQLERPAVFTSAALEFLSGR